MCVEGKASGVAFGTALLPGGFAVAGIYL